MVPRGGIEPPTQGFSVLAFKLKTLETETSSIEELEKEVEQLRREIVTARIQENLKND